MIRLSISESDCAANYQFSNRASTRRTEYSSDPVTAIMQAMDNLHVLIHAHCRTQLSNKSNNQVKKLAVDSAKIIIRSEKFKDHEVKEAITRFIRAADDKIKRAANTCLIMPDLFLIAQLILKAFPSISGAKQDKLIQEELAVIQSNLDKLIANNQAAQAKLSQVSTQTFFKFEDTHLTENNTASAASQTHAEDDEDYERVEEASTSNPPAASCTIC